MNEKARKRIEEKIEEMKNKQSYVYPLPEKIAGPELANYSEESLVPILKKFRDHCILQGIQYGLEKALEFIDEEKGREEK